MKLKRKENGKLIGEEIDRKKKMRNIRRIGRKGGKKGKKWRKEENNSKF